jgi:hypothetical protein
MAALDLGQQVGHLALGGPAAQGSRQERTPTLELPRQGLEHQGGDMGHAGEDEDIAQPDAGRSGHPVLDQLGALGDPRHPEPRLGHPAASRIIGFEDRARPGMDDDGPAERRGDGIDGDVVMGRADPAGGEQIIVLGAERVHRRRDPFDHVGDHPDLVQPDALEVEPAADLGDIAVLGPARQDLVADHQQGGGPDAFGGQGAGLRRFEPSRSPFPSSPSRRRVARPAASRSDLSDRAQMPISRP